MKQIYFTLVLLISSFALRAETYIYFHGGPGFNSAPERKMLAPHFEKNGDDIHFWDEPSILRPANSTFEEKDAYKNSLKSAVEFSKKIGPAVVIGHSFGAFQATYLALKYPELVKKLILVAPSFNLHDSDLNILNLGLSATHSNPDKFQELVKTIPKVENHFGPNKMKALITAASEPTLFTYYWNSIELMSSYFQEMTGRYAVDFKSFLAVRKSFFELNFEGKRIQNKTTIVFGMDDRASSLAKQIPNIELNFTDFKVKVIPGGHYPHLESPTDFIKLLTL